MDLVALLQVEPEVECTRVHYKVEKDGHNVKYLPEEPKCTPEVSGWFIQPYTKAYDVIQLEISGEGLCTDTILGENRLEEREIKWIKVEGEPRHF